MANDSKIKAYTASECTTKAIAMPSDTNPDGDMFGGWILSQMDLAAYVHARRLAKHKVVTVAIDNIVFHRPVFVGDCLECFARIEKKGRSSVTVKVEAYVERRDSKEKDKVTEGRFVFVSIGSDRKPMALGD